MSPDIQYPRVPLKFVSDVRPSGVDKHTVENETPVRLCNYTDVYHQQNITNDLPFMAATATPSEIEGLSLSLGDITMTKDSETSDDIGIPAIVTEPLDNVVLGYHTTLLRPVPGAMEPRFLFWYLNSTAAASYWERKARGVTRVGLRTEDVAALPVPSPLLETQRRVADMLDAETARIDTLIAENERVIQLLKLRLRAEVLRILTGGDAVSVVGQAPVTYAETARLGLVVDTQLGKMLTPKPDSGMRETPYVKASDVLHDGRVRLSGLDTMYASAQERRELSLRKDDVLIIEGGATAGKAARVGDQPTEGIIFQNHVHRLRTRSTHLQSFLYWCMKAYEWTGWYDAYCFVTTFKGLPTGKLRSLPLPVLPINEQRRIVGDIEERADNHEHLARLVERQNELLRLRRQALITAAVTGQIEV